MMQSRVERVARMLRDVYADPGKGPTAEQAWYLAYARWCDAVKARKAHSRAFWDEVLTLIASWT